MSDTVKRIAPVKRIAMWSGPRNISTAMMRSFENRPDTMVVDEPLYAYYLTETGLTDHPGGEATLASQPHDWRDVAKELTAELPEGMSVFYQKHMSHHLLDGVERSWMDGFTHAFLIRDPARMLASYVQKREAVTLEDIGLPQQLELFNRMADKNGAPPPVVDSADVLMAPEIMLPRLCKALGILYHTSMLHWPAGPRDSDGAWGPWWYDSVVRSTGFAPYEEKEIVIADHLLPVLDAALPIYEQLKPYAIKLN